MADARETIARAFNPDLFNDDWGIAAKEAHPFSVPEAREETMEDIDRFLAALAAAGQTYEDGVKAERERCRRIVFAARMGEIDQDFRCVWHYVNDGKPYPAAPTTGGDNG